MRRRCRRAGGGAANGTGVSANAEPPPNPFDIVGGRLALPGALDRTNRTPIASVRCGHSSRRHGWLTSVGGTGGSTRRRHRGAGPRRGISTVFIVLGCRFRVGRHLEANPLLLTRVVVHVDSMHVGSRVSSVVIHTKDLRAVGVLTLSQHVERLGPAPRLDDGPCQTSSFRLRPRGVDACITRRRRAGPSHGPALHGCGPAHGRARRNLRGHALRNCRTTGRRARYDLRRLWTVAATTARPGHGHDTDAPLRRTRRHGHWWCRG
mmetsp:Transcript_24767/g.69086  ORF Transcript_24767/g.69086 Transcript_24767/m.69086 type:complete len:264 (-) Transcript_24767:137-928(-)